MNITIFSTQICVWERVRPFPPIQKKINKNNAPSSFLFGNSYCKRIFFCIVADTTDRDALGVFLEVDAKAVFKNLPSVNWKITS